MIGGLLLDAITATLADLVPVAAVIAAFHLLLRRRPARLGRIAIGAAHLVVGLTLFRFGLEEFLQPLGSTLVAHLTDAEWVGANGQWWRYAWLYAFAAAVGFASALAEPALIAVAGRAEEVSGGAIRSGGLRFSVAIGMALGLTAATLRIVVGWPLTHLIGTLVAAIAILVLLAPRSIVSLALDTGGMATSVSAVPLIAVIGVGVADAIPGRSAFADGFGLVVVALLAPIASVLLVATLQAHRASNRPGPGR